MGLLDWFLQPLEDIQATLEARKIENAIIEKSLETKQEDNPITLEPTNINTDVSSNPKNFEEYIGQEKAKILIKAYIRGTEENNIPFPHTLIIGPPGQGKTTLAKIIANELKKDFIEKIASTFKIDISDTKKIEAILNAIKGTVFFLDEIHALPRDMVEGFFYNSMENTKKYPFTLIGATTEVGEILKTKKPFYDRFKLIIELDSYTETDMSQIVEQYVVKNHKKTLSKDIIHVIAKNSRLNPRFALRLTDSCIYLNNDINQVLNVFNILDEGFTINDLKILSFLQKNEKGVGINNLADYLNTSIQNFSYNIEPYLTQKEVIIRDKRGRKLTKIGEETIKRIQKLVK